MSQHDFVIANQGMPAARADINAALQALASTNKGAAAPTTPYTGELWIDDAAAPWTLKTYDGVDWIAIGKIDATANLFEPVANVVSEATAAAGVTVDGVLCKDGGVTLKNAQALIGTRTDATTRMLVQVSATDAVLLGDPAQPVVVNASSLQVNTIADAGAGAVTMKGLIARTTGETVINETAQDLDFRIEGLTDPNLGKFDASLDAVAFGDVPTANFGKVQIAGGLADGSSYIPLSLRAGASTRRLYFEGQYTAGVSTTATTIYARIDVAAGKARVYGNDGTSRFYDEVVFDVSAAPVATVSQNLVGTPQARTYSRSGTSLQLTMGAGAGSYNIMCWMLGMGVP